jgi:hypothetical protein
MSNSPAQVTSQIQTTVKSNETRVKAIAARVSGGFHGSAIAAD